MMMKFSVAAKSVVSEVCANAKKRYTNTLKKVNSFFSWSNFKSITVKMFRASFRFCVTVGSMLRECFLSMMLDIFTGILPIVKWVVRIAVILLPVAYAVPPSYGLTDFVWPALIGSVALYMFVSFFTKVFAKMLTKTQNSECVNQISQFSDDKSIKNLSKDNNENTMDKNHQDDKDLNYAFVKENQDLNNKA